MITKITGEAAFQVMTSNFSISPSQEGYTLQISADGKQYSNLFSVGAGVTRLVTGVAANSYYRLLGNQSQVSVNWLKTCATEGGGSGSGTELAPVEEFPLGAAEGTVVALASGDTVGLYQFIDGEWVLVGADDPTKLLAVNELPASAEPGTVMALSAEDVAYWDLSGDIALFKPANGFCFEETPGLEKITATTIIATLTEPYYPGQVSVYYENGILHYWDPGGEGIGYITPGQAIYFRTGYPDAPFIWFYCQNANELQVYVGKDWHEYVSGWTAIPDFVPYNISSNIVGLYQYDGQNWNEVGGDVDLSAYWTSGETQEKLEDMQLPIAAAVNELKGDFEARLDQQYYKKAEVNDIAARKVEAGQVDAQIKDYVDPAVAEVNDTIEDKELPVSAALNKLNEDIATIDEVIPAAIVDINDRMVSSSTVKTIWRGSQNEYDAITVKDAATLYIII